MLFDGLDPFEQPARGAGGRALAVVQPSTVEQVRDVVRWAVRERVRLLPQGANTGLVGSSTPDSSGSLVVLSTERLTAPVEIDVIERTCTVLAGVRLSTLNAEAARHGLHLPIDLGADPALGGMISTNTGGSRVLRYGPLRHHVLAVEAIAATSAADQIGGVLGLRKDARGVDLAQLLIGAGGCMGVVTQVTLALTPLPERTETWWVLLVPGREIDLLAHLQGRAAGLSAYELVSRAALAAAVSMQPTSRSPFPLNDIPDTAALIESVDPDRDHLDAVLAAAAEHGFITDAVRVPPTIGWGLRHSVSEGLRHAGAVLGHDVAVPRRRIPSVREAARELVTSLCPRAQLCDFGHVGDGGLHLNLLFPHGVAPPTPAERTAVRAAIDELVAADGTFSAEHGLGPLNAERWRAETPAIEQQIIAALKRATDPFGLLGHPQHPYNLVS
jgi:FAD/FMN-containing dehydrogenase